MTQSTNSEQIDMKKPRLFELGRVVATPGELEACSREYMLDCLNRHVRGVMCTDDQQSNVEALSEGSRIHSAYPIDPAHALCRISGLAGMPFVLSSVRAARHPLYNYLESIFYLKATRKDTLQLPNLFSLCKS